MSNVYLGVGFISGPLAVRVRGLYVAVDNVTPLSHTDTHRERERERYGQALTETRSLTDAAWGSVHIAYNYSSVCHHNSAQWPLGVAGAAIRSQLTPGITLLTLQQRSGVVDLHARDGFVGKEIFCLYSVLDTDTDRPSCIQCTADRLQ